MQSHHRPAKLLPKRSPILCSSGAKTLRETSKGLSVWEAVVSSTSHFPRDFHDKAHCSKPSCFIPSSSEGVTFELRYLLKGAPCSTGWSGAGDAASVALAVGRKDKSWAGRVVVEAGDAAGTALSVEDCPAAGAGDCLVSVSGQQLQSRLDMLTWCCSCLMSVSVTSDEPLSAGCISDAGLLGSRRG